MIVKKIDNEIYPKRFVFVIAKTRKEVLKKYSIKWNEVGGSCYHRGKIWIIIHPNESLNTLVHECDHAVSELWRLLGIKKLKGPDECYAYMMGWLFERCYETFKKHKNNKR